MLLGMGVGGEWSEDQCVITELMSLLPGVPSDQTRRQAAYTTATDKVII